MSDFILYSHECGGMRPPLDPEPAWARDMMLDPFEESLIENNVLTEQDKRRAAEVATTDPGLIDDADLDRVSSLAVPGVSEKALNEKFRRAEAATPPAEEYDDPALSDFDYDLDSVDDDGLEGDYTFSDVNWPMKSLLIAFHHAAKENGVTGAETPSEEGLTSFTWFAEQFQSADCNECGHTGLDEFCPQFNWVDTKYLIDIGVVDSGTGAVTPDQLRPAFCPECETITVVFTD